MTPPRKPPKRTTTPLTVDFIAPYSVDECRDRLTGQQIPSGFQLTRSGQFTPTDARRQYQMDGDGATEKQELKGLLKGFRPGGGTPLGVGVSREELRDAAGLQVGGRVDHAEDLAS